MNNIDSESNVLGSSNRFHRKGLLLLVHKDLINHHPYSLSKLSAGDENTM
jgi:hypothetical protein